MTRYSIDPARHELIGTWGTGEGDLATRIAALPAEVGTSALLGLARALTQLSDALWRTYTHPASAAGSLEPNTEGWRREQERQAFGEVAGAIAEPNLPSGGTMVVSYSRLIESANRVGRALHELDDPDLTKAVLAETATELAAVESAELGDLTERAQQAVLLYRVDASPVQVAAADRLLEQDPFGPAELSSAVDPTAAAVAAAEVTADASGYDPIQVVLEADNIEALPHETPTLVSRSSSIIFGPLLWTYVLLRPLPWPSRGARAEYRDRGPSRPGRRGPVRSAHRHTSMRSTGRTPRRPARGPTVSARDTGWASRQRPCSSPSLTLSLPLPSPAPPNRAGSRRTSPLSTSRSRPNSGATYGKTAWSARRRPPGRRRSEDLSGLMPVQMAGVAHEPTPSLEQRPPREAIERVQISCEDDAPVGAAEGVERPWVPC